jgi:hypothetical protein
MAVGWQADETLYLAILAHDPDPDPDQVRKTLSSTKSRSRSRIKIMSESRIMGRKRDLHPASYPRECV